MLRYASTKWQSASNKLSSCVVCHWSDTLQDDRCIASQFTDQNQARNAAVTVVFYRRFISLVSKVWITIVLLHHVSCCYLANVLD